MSQSTDQRILDLIAKRDERFVSLLYDQYADRLYGLAYRILKNDAAAQDAIQESFVKIWKKAVNFDASKARLFTWTYSIVRNTAIDKLRSMQKRDTREIQIKTEDVSHMGHSDVIPEHMDLSRHMSSLEDKYREVLEVLFFQGMTQQEASEALDVPLGTVKTRLKIALRELRKIFTDTTMALLIALLMI